MSYPKDLNLTQMLTKYKHKETTKNELLSVTKSYPSLEIKQEPYVFSNGTRLLLVNLQGTIPILYKGSSYNIPVCIWLIDTHPDNPPLCYVKPTPSMKIKVSPFVDPNGKILCPYLHDWSPGQSNLLTLIQTLIAIFSTSPPLFQVSTPVMNNATNLPYPPQPPTTNFYMPMPSPYPPSLPAASTSMPYLPYPTVSSVAAPYPPVPPPAQPTGTISEQHIRISLLSAAEEKVRRRLKEHFAQTQAELDTLEKIHEELVQGKSKLQQMVAKLEAKQCDWEKNLATLRDRDTELEQALARVKDSNGTLEIDEAVTTTAPLYNQLVQAFAEEAAAEDAIYYLGEALRRGVIDLDVFLKQVRALARKQFMLRALMHKCRAKAGLPAA